MSKFHNDPSSKHFYGNQKVHLVFILQYKTVALHLVKSSKSAVMKASSFYGAGWSRPRIRFLASAKDIVEF